MQKSKLQCNMVSIFLLAKFLPSTVLCTLKWFRIPMIKVMCQDKGGLGNYTPLVILWDVLSRFFLSQVFQTWAGVVIHACIKCVGYNAWTQSKVIMIICGSRVLADDNISLYMLIHFYIFSCAFAYFLVVSVYF